MSDLDQALENYIQDETQQDAYYQLVLTSDFYIPIATPPTGSDRPLESVTPLILTSEQKHYIMLFDSEVRLTTWAKKPVDFVILTGARAAAVSTPELHWAVNVGSERAKEFVPEEIDWLKKLAG